MQVFKAVATVALPLTLALPLSLAVPTAASAFGIPGCADLPEHDRAIGALEGMTGACDMSVEQARKILAAQDGRSVADQPVAAAPPSRRRHRRSRRGS